MAIAGTDKVNFGSGTWRNENPFNLAIGYPF
jgi:hypothetical protein